MRLEAQMMSRGLLTYMASFVVTAIILVVGFGIKYPADVILTPIIAALTTIAVDYVWER